MISFGSLASSISIETLRFEIFVLTQLFHFLSLLGLPAILKLIIPFLGPLASLPGGSKIEAIY
jgi:hypothetical protein